ncbi:peptide deformylase [Mesobaculum littorinae]|uniref:Peptide deformylase n=1 Tax=Mesobaculum littorinae TaxID=2486419 RepID=A0A438ADQ3_9RHOB|nr:peptide deformylase [Mesobaculum littorinae]RVV96797.1 peptide deformylase [Mesobaculum littorinae]
MIRPLRFWPDPVLQTPCPPVDPADPAIAELAADMIETLYHAQGRGLAAPQVGVAARVFVTDVTWKDGTPAPRIFLNPRIVDHATTLATNDEACLSIPGIAIPVTRPDEIELEWQDPGGALRRDRFTGMSAVIMQHELDHLDGVVTFDRVEAADRDAYLRAYDEAQV